jgi:hypothetical protein
MGDIGFGVFVGFIIIVILIIIFPGIGYISWWFHRRGNTRLLEIIGKSLQFCFVVVQLHQQSVI